MLLTKGTKVFDGHKLVWLWVTCGFVIVKVCCSAVIYQCNGVDVLRRVEIYVSCEYDCGGKTQGGDLRLSAERYQDRTLIYV